LILSSLAACAVLFVLIYLIGVLLVLTGLGSMVNNTQIPEFDGALPFLSIVVPFRNEAKNLPTLLKSITSGVYPSDKYEIILVNDYSSDLWNEALSNCSSVTFNVVQSVGGGKKQAILAGVEIAKGEYVVTTDADCIFPSNWLLNMAGIIQKESPDLIIGLVKLTSNGSFFQDFQYIDHLSLQLSTAGMALNNRPIMCSGANLAFKKQFYYCIKDELKTNYLSGDDMFLLHEAIKQKKSIQLLNNPESVVLTESEQTFKTLLNQRIRWASKSKGYSNLTTIGTAIIVLLANISLVFLFVSGLWSLNLLGLWGGCMILKMYIEWRMFNVGQAVIPFPKNKLRFVLVELIHPIFIVGIAFTGFLFNVGWKGRKVHGSLC